ncbi:MAG: DUF2752 domain-containing protein [Lachnospiraceae bacterium]|nr:DUF2752 domain-containing protein [Lachnospiraceae bacterium]
MDQKNNHPLVITLYNIGKVVLIWGLMIVAAHLFGVLDDLKPLLYCRFKRHTGLYCPGCGGTRAVEALLEGNITESLYYHCFVLYFLLSYIYFMARVFLNLHFNVKTISIKSTYLLIYLGIALLFIQWIVKNYFLLFLDYRWIP